MTLPRILDRKWERKDSFSLDDGNWIYVKSRVDSNHDSRWGVQKKKKSQNVAIREVEVTNGEKTAWVFQNTLGSGPSPLLEAIATWVTWDTPNIPLITPSLRQIAPVDLLFTN